MNALKVTDNICLWCGEFTGEGGKEIEKKGEHIFPESIGGKLYLPRGCVCKNCNNTLNKFDKALRYGHPAMMNAYQVDPNIKGKKISGKDPKKVAERDRRIKEKKKEIKGEGGILRFDNGNSRSFINSNYITTSENFLRGLHKCIANILCNEFGSEKVRTEYPELISFVKNGGNIRYWSYALSIPNLFNHPYISVPQPLHRIQDENSNQIVHSFIHTSGIWLVGAKPNALNPLIIEKMSQAIFGFLQLDKYKHPVNGESASKFFGINAFIPKKRIGIGPLNFYWVIEEIQGKPNDEFLYLLAECPICGQTNPTGIVQSRDILHSGNRNIGVGYHQNSWNHYIREDFVKFGYNLEKWDKESIQRRLRQAITLPKENDVRKLKIKNCKTKCINCGQWINYNAEDCFI